MNATPEQLAAIQTIDHALLVEAGAGTGKTWALVQRFLYLLEQHPGWPLSSVFAITYTEKAAREMRTRIRRAVEAQARQHPENPAWQARRRELEQMQVGTIHSLCARILRENAIAAGVDPHFQVLDERDAVLLKEEAVERALALLVAGDEPPTSALDLLITLQVRDLREQMAGFLQKRGTLQRLFDTLPAPVNILEGWRAGVSAMRAAIWQEALQKNADLHRALEEIPGIVITDSQDKLSAAVLLGQQGCRSLKQEGLVLACQYWGQINLAGGRAAAWGDKALMEEIKADLKTVRDLAKAWEKAGYLLEVGAADEQAAQALQQWQALWQAVFTVYDQMKAERYALDFDDLELHTSRLLAQQPRSERLQAFLDGICHLMVDEFQDTNQSQQAIVYTLAHPQDGGRLFVVGDAKQSIYRFRQAQVAVFNHTAQDIQHATNMPPVPLRRSFRTHQHLVAALNALFDVILQPAGTQPADYEALPGPLEHQRLSPGGREPVELLLLPEKTAQDERISAEDCRVFEARLLAEKLLGLQARGFPVWDRELNTYRPFRFDDAAILFRSTTSMVLYEEQFKAAGLPYLTISGRGYFDRPEVRDLISLLTCLYNPSDDLSLAAVLRSPMFNLHDETLYRLRWHYPIEAEATEAVGNLRSAAPIPYQAALRHPPINNQPAEIGFAAKVMEELWALTGRAEIWQLLHTALERTGYEAALAHNDHSSGPGRMGGRQRNNMLKFLEWARQDGSADLSAFLRRLEDLRASEAREGEALANAPESGAVQVMTIHASKGLEFPVVIVADLGRSQQRSGDSPNLLHDPAFGLACKLRDSNGDWNQPASYIWARWLNERMDAAESKRLLYVACTRAADLLILSGQVAKSGSWLEDILAAWDIAPDGDAAQLVEKDGYTLHVLRPAYSEAGPQSEPEQWEVHTAGLELHEMPAFALPLPTAAERPPLAVTQLDSLSGLDGAAEAVSAPLDLLSFPPSVRALPDTPARAPSYLVGRIIHRALADWSCLELPDTELAQLLERYARREGLLNQQAISDTLRRSMRILNDLRQSDLYKEVCIAAQRYSEVPFTLTVQGQVLHGVIDLLYQDNQGDWHLIDWKSEWIAREQLPEQAARHCLQLAIYSEAAFRVLGVRPQAATCFLAAQARVWRYTPADLEAALLAEDFP